MYCSLDKIDFAAKVDGQMVGVQTDHRTSSEIEDELTLSVLYALVRVLNARAHLAEEGAAGAAVHYVVTGEPPPLVREALVATGAKLERMGTKGLEVLGEPSPDAASDLADRQFATLAREVAHRVGTRDLGMALRMLEDQTFADPPKRDDEVAYWRRVLELAALAGELLRAKHPGGCWVQSDRALIPFGFQVAVGTAGATVMFPTNRAQRVVEDGRDESLFKLLVAAEETLEHPPNAATGRLMPSLRDRRNVDLAEVLWRPLIADGDAQLPIVVYGVDGESTFGMIRRDALDRPEDEAIAEALANLAFEPVHGEKIAAGDATLLAYSGTFYATEKLLDRAFLQRLHRELDAELLAIGTPARGLLMAIAAREDNLARFSALVRMRHDDAGGRAVSPIVMLVEDGFVIDAFADPSPLQDETEPKTPRLRRLLGRK